MVWLSGQGTEEAPSEPPALHPLDDLGVNGRRVSPVEGGEPGQPAICRARGCRNRRYRHGLCRAHYEPSARPTAGFLWVECWCGRSKVEVRKDRIGLDGGSCGRVICKETL